MLMEIANSFLHTIIDSLETVPYGIRWICKQIRSPSKRRFPEASDTAIHSLIGGFFFLRFINPTVVTTQSYMLSEAAPAKHLRRTLTLIAKLLQNFANKPTYAKEQYMITLNPFVENNKTRINEFLNNICDTTEQTKWRLPARTIFSSRSSKSCRQGQPPLQMSCMTHF